MKLEGFRKRLNMVLTQMLACGDPPGEHAFCRADKSTCDEPSYGPDVIGATQRDRLLGEVEGVIEGEWVPRRTSWER